jgi:hypothetical protein
MLKNQTGGNKVKELSELNFNKAEFDALLREIEDEEESGFLEGAAASDAESCPGFEDYADGGFTIPTKYADYMDPAHIDPGWKATTCTVIQLLEEMHWLDLSTDERKLYFSNFQEIAARDVARMRRPGTESHEYLDFCSKYVYAIAYRTTWAYASKFCWNKNELQDNVAEALRQVSTNPNLISHYNPDFAPSTFLNGLIRTSLSNAYYANSGNNKKLKLVRLDVAHVNELFHRYDPMRTVKKIPVTLYYMLLETRRAQPAAWQDIKQIVEENEPHVIYDNYESVRTVGTASGIGDMDSLEDSPLFEAVKELLQDPSDLRIFLEYYESAQSQLFCKAAKKSNDPGFKRYEELVNILSHHPRIRAFSARRFNDTVDRVSLSLGKEKIAPSIAEEVGLGEIIDHVDL